MPHGTDARQRAPIFRLPSAVTAEQHLAVWRASHACTPWPARTRVAFTRNGVRFAPACSKANPTLPQGWFADVRVRIADALQTKLATLLLRNWAARSRLTVALTEGLT
jgi:hypothetical protein